MGTSIKEQNEQAYKKRWAEKYHDPFSSRPAPKSVPKKRGPKGKENKE